MGGPSSPLPSPAVRLDERRREKEVGSESSCGLLSSSGGVGATGGTGIVDT